MQHPFKLYLYNIYFELKMSWIELKMLSAKNHNERGMSVSYASFRLFFAQ